MTNIRIVGNVINAESADISRTIKFYNLHEVHKFIERYKKKESYKKNDTR